MSEASSPSLPTPAPSSAWFPIVIPLDNFLKADIQPKEPIIEGFLYSQCLAMIYAKRGVGKTRLAASLAVSIATATDFLIWRIPKPRRVLFIDGELSAPDLQNIFRDFTGNEEVSNLDIISSETFSAKYGQGLNIATKENQEEFWRLLDNLRANDRSPEVIVFDNHSSLTGGLDENDNSKQEAVLSFFRKLRHLGYTVILIHHAGKSGDQRGATRREDFLDLVIKLEAKESFDGSANFDLSITKSRWKMAQRKFACQLVRDISNRERLTWTIRRKDTTESNSIDEDRTILQWIARNKPESQAEIVRQTNRSKSSVSRHIIALQDKGYLDQEITITDKGKEFLDDE